MAPKSKPYGKERDAFGLARTVDTPRDKFAVFSRKGQVNSVRAAFVSLLECLR